MLFRSFAQLLALLLFAFVFVLVLLVLTAFFGYLGPEARAWTEWLQKEAINHRDLIQQVFAVVGAVSTLTISALGIYKTWHFADLNLPVRLEELSNRWRRGTIRDRVNVVPELGLVHSIAAVPTHQRSQWSKFVSLIYDGEQAALLRCSRKVDRVEAELKALQESQRRCQAEMLTGYLELGSRMRQCDPQNSSGILNLFKKPLETDGEDWDALELAGRQALAAGMRQLACRYLAQLIEATESRNALRHARALRFNAEVLHGGSRVERNSARAGLERAITVLEDSDAGGLALRKEELGLAYELLAKVHIASARFRLARTALSAAKQRLGDIERLRELDGRANPG